MAREDADTQELLASAQVKGKSTYAGRSSGSAAGTELVALIGELTAQMHLAASELQFELAARLRDEISDLKRELRGMKEAGSD